MPILVASVGSFQFSSGTSDLDVVAAGDWGCTGNSRKLVDIVIVTAPDLVLALGDYSYANTADCWLDVIKPIDSLTRINIGNHDDESKTLLRTYLQHFDLTQQYYGYDIKNIHVLTISTEVLFKVGSEQYNFVLHDLQKAAYNPAIKWIIVNMHFPLYASPNTCGDRACEGDGNVRDTYHPLFDKYGVDLVLQGHVHNYQRSYPLMFDSASSSSPIITSCDKESYQDPQGQIYVIVGTGGINLHGLSGKSHFMANQQDSKFGILNIHSSSELLDVKFIDGQGKSFDQFNVTKEIKNNVAHGSGEINATDTTKKNLHCDDLILFKEKNQSNKDSKRDKVDKNKDIGKPKQESKKTAGKCDGKGNKGGGNSDGKGNKGGGKGHGKGNKG